MAIISPNENIITADSTMNNGNGSICACSAASRITDTSAKVTSAP